MGEAVHHAEGDPVEEAGRLLLGLRLFILSEIMLFGAFFAAYFVLRGEAPSWPPSADLERPGLLLVGVNTLILVSSSVTLQWAINQVRRGNEKGLRQGLVATLVLGGIFLVVQVYEFLNNGFGIADGAFGSTFYSLTGLHGLHVLTGLVLIGVVANRARLGLVSRDHHTALEAVSLYWHFVDVVWVTLFLTVYVL